MGFILPNNSNPRNQKSKPAIGAFTLAEVLITLAIIGVVAAITIPILLKSQSEVETVARLKKAYSTLANAYEMAAKEDGTPDNWGLQDTPTPEMFDKLTPFMKVNKSCLDGASGCFKTGETYKYLGSSAGYFGVPDDWALPKLKLADGTLLLGGAIESKNCSADYGDSMPLKNVCARYWVDINGDKKPNQIGKDFFMFWLTKNGIVPVGTQQQTSSYTFDYCNTAGGNGDSCTAWVLYNENLDYLECNDLSWNTKLKCN